LILRGLFFLSFVVFGSAPPLYSEDLQITDYLGLIRAQRSIKGKAIVSITVKHSDHGEPFDKSVPLLTQRTGIALDIESVQSSPNQYRFLDVAPGVWRIRLRNKGLLLDNVSIEE